MLFSKIPIGDSQLTGVEGKKLYHMGVRPGVPDFLIIKAGRILFVEMKRAARAKVSLEQHLWINAISTCNDAHAVVCYGYLDAKDYTEKYYGLETTNVEARTRPDRARANAKRAARTTRSVRAR